jgi:hypothetical protein
VRSSLFLVGFTGFYGAELRGLVASAKLNVPIQAALPDEKIASAGARGRLSDLKEAPFERQDLLAGEPDANALSAAEKLQGLAGRVRGR